MDFSRNQKAFFSAWVIVLVALGGFAFGKFPAAGALVVVIGLASTLRLRIKR